MGRCTPAAATTRAGPCQRKPLQPAAGKGLPANTSKKRQTCRECFSYDVLPKSLHEKPAPLMGCYDDTLHEHRLLREIFILK